MELVALVTLLLLLQYLVFIILCGKARAAGGVKAPAVTGGFLANTGLLLTALWGVVTRL